MVYKTIISTATANCALCTDITRNKFENGAGVIVKTAYNMWVNCILNTCGIKMLFNTFKMLFTVIAKMGYYFGIGGVLTYKNARTLVETVEYVPIEQLLLETDCPYLSPVPNRGKRNDSSNLRYVAEKIAEIKNMSYDAVVEITEKNAKRFFFGKE